MEQEPREELTLEKAFEDLNETEDRVMAILDEWKDASASLEPGSSEMLEVDKRYASLFEDAQTKARDAFGAFKALLDVSPEKSD